MTNHIIDKLRDCPRGGCFLTQKEALGLHGIIEQSARLALAASNLTRLVERQDAVSATGQDFRPLVEEEGYIWSHEDAGKLTTRGNVIGARSHEFLARGTVYIRADETLRALNFGWQTDGPPIETEQGALVQRVTR